MQKRQSTKRSDSLSLHREALQPLRSTDLRGVTGGSRISVPDGYTDDGTPVYADGDAP